MASKEKQREKTLK
jgi:hypothetical protein